MRPGATLDRLTAQERKERPITTGVLDYFPDALAEVAYCSFVGNRQHNLGPSVHWDRAKSTDEADAAIRHVIARGTRDTDGVRHTAKAAWRLLALLQKEIEEEYEHEQSLGGGGVLCGAPGGVGAAVQGKERHPVGVHLE